MTRRIILGNPSVSKNKITRKVENVKICRDTSVRFDSDKISIDSVKYLSRSITKNIVGRRVNMSDTMFKST